MCNAAIKRSAIIASAAISAMLMVSCGSTDKEKATQMLDNASELYRSEKYDKAIAILDSIDSIYPAEVDIRRKAMHLRPQIVEHITLKQIAETDSLMAVTQLKSDSIGQYIAFVDNPVEGYYVASGFKGKDPATTPGIYARMTPDGQFYILSSINKPIHSTSVSISLPDGTVAATPAVQYDGERNDRFGSVEIITFMQSECDTIGALAASNSNGNFTLNFTGDKTVSIPLPQAQLTAIEHVYTAATLLRELKVLHLRKAHLEKQLQLSRNQQARTFTDDDGPAE